MDLKEMQTLQTVETPARLEIKSGNKIGEHLDSASLMSPMIFTDDFASLHRQLKKINKVYQICSRF